MEARFERWRQAVQSTLPSGTVRGNGTCTILAPEHTYASSKDWEAYTFRDHDSLEQAKAFTADIVTCWSGPSGPRAGWMKTRFDQLIHCFETFGEYDDSVGLQQHSELWAEFKAFGDLVESVHVCGYLGCGTWEHSHFCVVFTLGSRFVTFRWDMSGGTFFDTENGDTDSEGFYTWDDEE